MRTLTTPLHLAAASLVLAAATACSSSSTLPSTLGVSPGALQSTAPRQESESNALPASTRSKALLYVADNANNEILVFDQTRKTPKLKYTITDGIYLPAGITTDQSGNLYVTNELTGPSGGLGTLQIYKPGSKTPFETITTGMNGPMDVKVDNSGNIYVANDPVYGTTRPWINFYPAGATRPSNTFYPPNNTTPVLTGIALVSPSEGSSTPIIASYFTGYDNYSYGGVMWCTDAYGCSNLGYSFGKTGGIAVEQPPGGSNALDFMVIDQYIPGFDNIVLDQQEKPFSTGGTPLDLALNSSRTALFVSNLGSVNEYTYPKMKLVNSYQGTLGHARFWGVAVSPDGTF